MNQYPIKEIIKKKADAAGKTLIDLGREIEKSDRWIHGIKSIDDLTLDMIKRLTRAVKFDLLKDYNEWCIKEDQMPIYEFNEPAGSGYLTKDKKISVNITLTASTRIFNQDFGNVLLALKNEGLKHGFDIG